MAGPGETWRRWQSRRGRRSLHREVARVLARPDGRVAVLGREQANPRVVRLDPALSSWVRHGRLAGAGPFDLLVDATGDAEAAVERFRACFLHVRRGGSYVVSGSAAETVSAFLDELHESAGPAGSAESAA